MGTPRRELNPHRSRVRNFRKAQEREMAVNGTQTPLRAKTNFTSHFNAIWVVQTFAQKYSAFPAGQITRITPLVSRQMRGVGHRHERAVRCGGR